MAPKSQNLKPGSPGNKIGEEKTPGGLSRSDIKTEFATLNPEPVQEAGSAYLNVSAALATACDGIAGHAAKLADLWAGDAADKTLAQFKKLHDTMVDLSTKSYSAGSVVTWLGGADMMGWYKSTGSNLHNAGLLADIEGHDGDHQAREFRDRYLYRLSQAYNDHPDEIQQDLPVPATTSSGYGDPNSKSGVPGAGGVNSPGSGSGYNPKLPTDHTKPPSSTIPNGPGGYNPGSGNNGGNYGTPGGGSGYPGGGVNPPGGGSSLAGMGGGNSMPGAGLGGGGGGGLGGGLGGGGGGLGGIGSGVPGGGLGAGGGLGGGLADTAAAANAMRAAEAEGAAGANGMPMGGMGGGRGGQEKEQERSTWLSEDEDVWGADGDVAPPVIG